MNKNQFHFFLSVLVVAINPWSKVPFIANFVGKVSMGSLQPYYWFAVIGAL